MLVLKTRMRKQWSRIRYWNTWRSSRAGMLIGCNHAGAQMDPSFLLRCPPTPDRSPPARRGEARLVTKSAVIWTELESLSLTHRAPLALETRWETLVAKVLVSHTFANPLLVSRGCRDDVGSGR